MKKRSYLYVCLPFLLILLLGICLDVFYHYSEIWKLQTTIIGKFCSKVKWLGFSYTGAFQILKNNFGILITAISVIITMSINISNRFERKVFGLQRKSFEFSFRTIIYKYGRVMIFAAPFIMILAINLEYCITGYFVLILSYAFLIFSYVMFDSSFSKEKDQEFVKNILLDSIPEPMQELDDISDYLTLLNSISQWLEKEKNWEEIGQIFLDICKEIKKYDTKKMYVFAYYFYDIVFVRKNTENSDQAVYALKKYIEYMDGIGWEEKGEAYYIILWGMIRSLIKGCPQYDVVYFIKWYLNYPMRSKKVMRNMDHAIDENDLQIQIGLLLIEIESFLHNNEQVDNYILESLPVMWNRGKKFLGTQVETFTNEYLSINEIYGFSTYDIKENIYNLSFDHQNNTKRSLVANLLSYKVEEE